MWNLSKGEDFLPSVSLGNLKRRYKTEGKAKSKLRLLCAIHRKEGKGIDDIAHATNMKRRTVHAILHRFIERGIDAKESIKQNGRPSKLTHKQREKLINLLDRGPPYNQTGLWTTKEVLNLIEKEFSITYHYKYIWEILTAVGFSIQKPRPRNYKAPSKWKQTHFKKRLQCWQNITGKEDL